MYNLAIQLAASALLIVSMTVVHGFGVVGIANVLRLDALEPRRKRLSMKSIGILIAVALLLFALHFLEIALFAAFYMATGALRGLEESLFFSATAYSTLAQPTEGFPIEWRLVGAIEGLVGFLLIGWSTAFFVTDMNRLLRE